MLLGIAIHRALFVILLLACSGLAWADAPPEETCRKPFTGQPGQENQPSYRLRCERAADGSERVQLLIEGEKAIDLTGRDGELAWSQPHPFDPDSASVRLFEGQPNLYWIRYEKTVDMAGGTTGTYQRHWVVRAGDVARTVFDEWVESFEGNRSGHGVQGSESINLSYRGSTLSAVKTRSVEEKYSGEFCEDWEFRCEEQCGCTDESKNCRKEECFKNCFSSIMAGVNSHYSLDKTLRMINVSAGHTTSEKAVWTKEFFPSRHLCMGDDAGTPLSFLVLDDGISGWLVIRDNRLLYDSTTDWHSPKHPVPDSENPGQIPAIAACWLYNRAPWNEANANRVYPPAPPDQARPGHFVPENCCEVKTSADGHRAFLYETAKDDDEKPQRLLAMFDGPSQSCYSVNLAKDGRWGKAPFDQLGNPVFNPDGGKLGYRAKQGNRWFVVVDDHRGPKFDRVSSPVFSPDGRHVAYWAKQDKKEFIVLDDQKGPAFDGAGFPVFSPDSSKVAYRVREGNQWFVMRGDRKSPTFDDIAYYTAPESGRGNDTADVVFSPDGQQLAYAARRGQQWFIVRDGQPGPAFEHVGLPVFSPDGRLAYRARRNDREFILLGEQKGSEFDFVSTPVFSPHSRQIAYWAKQGNKEFIMRGEQKGPVFDKVGAPVFNRDGSQVVYWAKQGDKEFIMTGEKKGPEFGSIEAPVFLDEQKGEAFDEVGDPVMSPDGSRLAYRARQGEQWFMVVDTLEGAKITAGVQAVPSSTLPLNRTVPTLIPHPVAVREPGTPSTMVVIGGSTKDRWIAINETKLPVSGISEGKCKPLGYEWIAGSLPYKLYSFDKPLGECTGVVSLCVPGDDYAPPLKVDFPTCAAKEPFSIIGIAAPWNILPRTPKILKNHQDFAPIIRKLLDTKGLKQAPVRIEYVHGIDLDGDGTEEHLINARSRKDCFETSTANDYAVFVLLRTVRGKPETTVISESWGESKCLEYETRNSSYADLNGDRMMEILQFGGSQEGDGLQVKALQAGKPVAVPLGYQYHF